MEAEGPVDRGPADRPVGSCEELTVVLGLAKEDGAGPRVVRRVEIRIQLCHKHTEHNTRREAGAIC